MIAYARGASPNFDIFVQNLTDPGSTPVNITNSNNVTDDRPAWSPDGTRIAWESEVTDGSGQMDVLIRDAPGVGPVTNFTNTATAGDFEGKPAWTPDSQTLLYQKGPDPMGPGDVDVMRRPAAGGSETLAISDSGVSEFQPSVSPDGSQVCFTLSTNGFNNTADVLVAPLTVPPSGGNAVSADVTNGDYNCAFSPDGTLVAYVNGIFGAGRLVMVRADDTSPIPIDLAQDPGADNFDGNPDWAPDGRPDCPDSAVATRPNTPLTFPVECVDTGPAYEQTNVREFSGSDPANGALEQEFAGDPFTYTPNQGFSGTDTFQVRSFDELGFGVDQGAVTILVGECAGLTATHVGTQGPDVIEGTPQADVISALGGADVARGLGGKDVVCGGKGRDRLVGGGGKDDLRGQAGPDTLKGGKGRDSLRGGKGRDKLIGGPAKDKLRGGPGRDQQTQ
jgi:Tol biopolymer transport system component